MRVLAITNMYPSAQWPTDAVFVKQQIKGLSAVGLEVRLLLIDRRREGPFVYYRMAPKIRGAIAEFKPDLIHVMYGGVMAEKIAQVGDSPAIILTFHGSDLLGKNLAGLSAKLMARYGVHCSKKAARHAQGVVVVSRHLIQAVPSSVSRDKIRVIPCGIDLERFKPMDQFTCQKELGWQPESFHVLFATSANDPVKRPWLARAAVERLAEQGVPTEFHILAGVPYGDVPVWINASDVFILTSLHEGSPTIVKEALACGVPVVSVDVGDVADRIEGIEGCYLAEAEPADLALKLRLVYQRRQRLDCRSRLEEISHIAVAHKLKQFYHETLAHEGRLAPSSDGRV